LEVQEAQKEGTIAQVNIVDTFKYHWKSVFITIGAKVVETAPFYIFSTFIISYATGGLYCCAWHVIFGNI
jgi:hypothetical protein